MKRSMHLPFLPSRVSTLRKKNRSTCRLASRKFANHPWPVMAMPVSRRTLSTLPTPKSGHPGGVIALVLPASFLQGQAWAASRRLLAAHYKDVVIITIATTGSTDRAFSADTGMAEVLVIATRRSASERAEGDALFVNLLCRPRTILEAVTVARAVRRIPAERPVNPIRVGTGERAGHSIRGAIHDTGAAGLLNADVADAAVRLVQGELLLPHQHNSISLPVVELWRSGQPGALSIWTFPGRKRPVATAVHEAR